MTEPALELEWELDRDRRKAAEKRIKILRKRMVMGAYFPDSVLRRVTWLIPESHTGVDEHGHQRAEVFMQKLFWIIAWVTLASLASLVTAAAITDSVGEFLFEHRLAAIALGLFGLACLALIMFDIAIYQPRVFALCSRSPTGFFRSIAQVSPTLEQHLKLIAEEKPTSWKRVKELENGLRAEAVDFLSLEGIRARLILRVLHRLAAVIASLALFGYGLAAATSTHALVICERAAQAGCTTGSKSVPDYGYFSLDSFFTGFSDISLVHAPAGYAYLGLTVVTFTVIIYFIFTEVISSQNEFHANFRASAESFVLQHSKL
jgi:hypothetical protein